MVSYEQILRFEDRYLCGVLGFAVGIIFMLIKP